MSFRDAKRYAMTVDTRRCVGCNACVIACKTENALPLGGFRDWIVQEVRGRFPDLSMQIRSERCNQCGDAPCVEACPTGASHEADGGVVLVTRSKCTGCKACVASCPYGARYVDPAGGFVDKCTFCLHRVRKGKDPACAATCPTRAITFGDLADPDSAVSKLRASRRSEVVRPEAGTEPNVFFLT
jgi:Fe-S-cluster-containing dehydrogenase component